MNNNERCLVSKFTNSEYKYSNAKEIPSDKEKLNVPEVLLETSYVAVATHFTEDEVIGFLPLHQFTSNELMSLNLSIIFVRLNKVTDS